MQDIHPKRILNPNRTKYHTGGHGDDGGWELSPTEGTKIQ